MIEKIIESCANNRFLVFAAVLLLTLGGVYALRNIPLDAIPGFHVSGRETYGHSQVVDPWGNALAQLPRGTGVVTAALDPEFQAATRRNFPCLDHRRLHCH